MLVSVHYPSCDEEVKHWDGAVRSNVSKHFAKGLSNKYIFYPPFSYCLVDFSRSKAVDKKRRET